MSTPAQDFTDQLDQLLTTFESLQQRAQYDDLSDLAKESSSLAARLQAALDRMTVPGDSFALAADAQRSKPSHIKVFELAYLAYALRDELKDGWTERITALVHADTSADMIQMATELSAASYKDAAAVVVGTALELHLRALALKHQLSTTDSKGKPKKAEVLRTDLRQQQVTSVLEDKRVLYWLGLRNDAAHGNYSNYTADGVKTFISEVTAFIDKHPA